MKIRQLFVSNSSSSSFILALKKDQSSKVKVSFDIDLEDLCDRDAIKSQKELDDAFIDIWGSSEETIEELLEELGKHAQAEYKEAKKALEEGKVLYFGEVCSDGDTLSGVIYDRGLINCVEEIVEGKIDVIQDGG
jgi:hypothetical protein